MDTELRMTRTSLTTLALSVALSACQGGSNTDEPASAEPESAEAAAEAAVAPDALACELTAVTPLIASVRLESEDGSCRLFLPHNPTAGDLTVRVSGVGAENVAALERAHEGATLYANGGRVTITTSDATRIAGTFDVTDDSEPGTGRVAGAFDIALPAAAPSGQ
ncbi:MAG: hypothetical protein ACJA1R_001498 [Flavobacteriales bacterium]|jgi:hypothetical protein